MNVHSKPHRSSSRRRGRAAGNALGARCAAVFAAALLIVAGGCTEGEPEPAANGDTRAFARAARVETIVVVPRTFDEEIQVTGAVEALKDATLAAQSSGKVETIAENGEPVEAGAVVARLDQGAARAAVQQAEAQIQTAEAQRALARDNRDRLLPLQDRKVISAREFEQARLQLEEAEASVRQAEAALANAQVQLANTVVQAPFAGTVEEAFLEPGEHAGVGDPLVRLIAIDEVKVVAGVPERYVPDLRAGMSVQLSFPSVDLQPRAGEVTFVGAAIEPLSRTFPIEVRLANAERDLKPMMLAELRVTRTRHTDVLTLPRSAIVTDELGPGVYVVDAGPAGTVARRRSVVLGADAVGFVIIAEGLEAGDEVIVLGQHNVSDGDPVQVGDRGSATRDALPDGRPSY
jgi:membrane fusion protein (multidrug efflux system)